MEILFTVCLAESSWFRSFIDFRLRSFVSGAPGSGKSTLLKMVANNLYKSKNHVAGGEVSIAGVTPSKQTYWSNLVAYIDQIDRLHPYLTVQETAEFAWKCRSGGTHKKPFFGEGPEVDELIAKMDGEMVQVNKILEVLGLAHVKDVSYMWVGGNSLNGSIRTNCYVLPPSDPTCRHLSVTRTQSVV
jgi:ABC-type cobalamin/Fe3+-siderophores transport system ATPase subunit